MVGGSGGKVVARLAADGTVYTTNVMKNQFTNLVNYKIKTDGDFLKRKASLTSTALGVPTTVVDLGKQLLQCARDNDIEGVRSAIARGAPYAHDWLGLTALHFAAMNDQYEICKLLLNSGINKDAKTKVDRTPLHFACFYGHYKIVQLLLSRNCQVNPRDMLLMTPLHWAVEKCYKSIVRLLLNYNADVTVVSKFDKTPIALAVLSEQADILQELENVRQKQITRKMNEEIKKETSEAVNSIMNLCNDDNDGGGSDIYCETLEVNGGANDVTIINLDENTTSDSVKNSTINMLESHGISLMPANNDESKDLLNTALKNGRQLILSEGGKLLLSETKQRSNNVVNNLHRIGGGNISNQQRSASNANVQLVNNNNNNNNNNAISKWRIKSEPTNAAPSTDGNSNHHHQHHLTTTTTTTSSSNVVGGTHNVPLSQNNNNKMRAPPSNLNNNIIVKKQRTSILQHAPTILGGGGGNGGISGGGGGGGGGGVNAQLAKITTANIAGKNKNIRLMSLNDFKKICGNTNLKPVQMSLSDTNNKTQVTNIRDIQTAKLQNANIIELTNLNETSSSDKDSSEAARGIMHKKPQPTASVRYYPAKLATVSTASGTPAHLVNSSTTTASIGSSNHQSSPQKLRLRQSAVHIQQFKPVGGSSGTGDGGTITPTSIASNAFLNNDNHNGNGRVVTTTLGDGSIICTGSTTLTTSSSSSSTNTHTQSHVVPLLTTPQICRQLLDLRKQHEELRRKYDLAEKEKEELRQRVERLEEFLLVEKTDIYSASS